MNFMTKTKGFAEGFLSWARQPKNYRWLVPLLVFILLIFLLKGCFSKNGNLHGDYLIARDPTWYPLNFVGKEKNVLGFADDLMFQIAKRKGLRVQLFTASPGDLLMALDNEVDGIFSSMTPDVILQEKYLFSESFYNLGAVLVVDPASGIKSLAEMKGKFVGVLRASSVLFNIPGHPNMRVIPYDSSTSMLDDVVNDKIDGALLNQLNAYNFTKGYYAGRLVVATPTLTSEGLRLITRTGRREARLVSAFNEGLNDMKADGSYHALLEKWGLHDPTIK